MFDIVAGGQPIVAGVVVIMSQAVNRRIGLRIRTRHRVTTRFERRWRHYDKGHASGGR